jgi:hypothetical protein
MLVSQYSLGAFFCAADSIVDNTANNMLLKLFCISVSKENQLTIWIAR